ncbi:hypothetical protein AB0I39_02980 [Kitasatospora purpeofusca]|uniref:hypothetical protein n=1 Tax=Kitasatospora purpeofusca TaxID=67352 RepID=UPI0033F2E290
MTRNSPHRPRVLDACCGAGGAAMGCTWMTNREARKAIPPAYTQHIADQHLTHHGHQIAA